MLSKWYDKIYTHFDVLRDEIFRKETLPKNWNTIELVNQFRVNFQNLRLQIISFKIISMQIGCYKPQILLFSHENDDKFFC